jgi:transcriptional regulator with XRE-family HTH domain
MVTSGVGKLDELLGGLFIGDNVVWHDDAGSLASVFCLNFMKVSRKSKKPIIYVTFDRSPRNLIHQLGALADYPKLVILDCFTAGKGAGSDVFLKFYEDYASTFPCQVLKVDHPDNPSEVMDALYGHHSQFAGDVRFVFESLTGMQELWGGEDQVLHFYSHSCPRLYELNTVAYWILEKNAHSLRLRANINQIAQVAIELSIRRGTTSLSILKAEKRSVENLQRPVIYWTKDLGVTFEDDGRTSAKPVLGLKIRQTRVKRGLSQSELARLVGVTPSTISQVEGNLIYPSLPALMKMAEILSVDVSSFFGSRARAARPIAFPLSEATEYQLLEAKEPGVRGRLLVPDDLETHVQLILVEIAPETRISSHFLFHKGEEAGYVISGLVQTAVGDSQYRLMSGDVIYLSQEVPSYWYNPGTETASLLWIKIG